MSENESQIRFEILDQGIGISEDVQKRLFESFSQADSSTTRAYGGLGLGLYLVKSFANLMNGNVGVKSSLGNGSEFWIQVPLKHHESSLAPSDGSDSSELRTENLHPILVVEDQLVNQVFTEALLKKLNLRSVVVSNGEEAVQAFEEGKFSLILMDCQMPIKDGYQATKEIRAKEKIMRIPIVALTANTDNTDRELCLEAGMDDMLSKPVKFIVFKEKVEHWLKNKTSGDSKKT